MEELAHSYVPNRGINSIWLGTSTERVLSDTITKVIITRAKVMLLTWKTLLTTLAVSTLKQKER
jgi:hypothetical protein